MLGLVLFNICINDLKVKNSSSSLCCDDISLLNRGKTIEEVKEKNRRSIDRISTWFTANNLQTTNQKTQKLTFQYTAEHKCAKLLGIFLDTRLNYCTMHIEYIYKKISTTIFLLRRIR